MCVVVCEVCTCAKVVRFDYSLLLPLYNYLYSVILYLSVVYHAPHKEVVARCCHNFVAYRVVKKVCRDNKQMSVDVFSTVSVCCVEAVLFCLFGSEVCFANTIIIKVVEGRQTEDVFVEYRHFKIVGFHSDRDKWAEMVLGGVGSVGVCLVCGIGVEEVGINGEDAETICRNHCRKAAQTKRVQDVVVLSIELCGNKVVGKTEAHLVLLV